MGLHSRCNMSKKTQENIADGGQPCSEEYFTKGWYFFFIKGKRYISLPRRHICFSEDEKPRGIFAE